MPRIRHHYRATDHRLLRVALPREDQERAACEEARRVGVIREENRRDR